MNAMYMGKSSVRGAHQRRIFRAAKWIVSIVAAVGLAACDDDTPLDPVVPPPSVRVASLAVSPAAVNLQAGQQATVQVDARDSLGAIIARPPITWQTDAPAVATIDANGSIRAVAPGAARITANAPGLSGNLSALVQVTVTASTPGIQQWRAARAGLSDVTFLGLWDDGAGSSYAVGQNGGMLRSRNDGPWEAVTLNTTETLVGVWGASPTDIWIVGTGGLVMRGDGVTFTRVEAGTTNALLEVWGLASNEVYITGERGTILRWDGTRLEPMVSGVTDEIWGIWGASSAAIFAAGNNGVLLRYDGVSWRRLISPDGTPYFDIWGTSAGNVFAVGVGGSIARYDGVAWTRMTTPGAANLFAVRGRAFNDIYAVGNGGATWHFDGFTWRTLSIGNGQNLRALALRGDGAMRLAGWYGTVVTLRGVGAIATATVDATDPPLLSTYGAPNGAMFAVGFGGSVFRRLSNEWALESVPSANDLYGISGNSATDIVAVGDTGSILRYDGATWRRDAPPTSLVLRAVWSGAGQHVIVGERGTILRSNGPAWSPQASGTQRFLRAVWGSDPANVFVVGDSGTVLRFDGGRWSPMAVPTQSRLRAVWGTGSSDVFAVGDSGISLRYDGVAWQALETPTRRDLRALWGRGPTEVYAVGDSGTVLRYDGSAWRPFTAPWRSIIYALFGVPGTNAVAAVGDGGRIFEGTP